VILKFSLLITQLLFMVVGSCLVVYAFCCFFASGRYRDEMTNQELFWYRRGMASFISGSWFFLIGGVSVARSVLSGLIGQFRIQDFFLAGIITVLLTVVLTIT
jgi:hypothetical protein